MYNQEGITMKEKPKLSSFRFWLLIWGLGIAGQLCWNMENQWFNTFVYAKIAKDPTIISWMVGVSAAATTFSTFLSGTLSDRRGRRKNVVATGYILWGVFTILFGMTQYITKGQPGLTSQLLMVAGISVVSADAIMSFFGSMGNDGGFNAWANDMMTDKNRGQIGAAMATQPVIGTLVGTVAGGMLVGKDDNYMRLFVVMGVMVILFGIFALVFMKDSPNLVPNKQGGFWKQFFSAFNFRRYFALRELVWVNLTLAVYFIAFNMYFTHMGNYIIYYLHFSADEMGLIEGIPLILAMLMVIPATMLINKNKSPLVCTISIILNCAGVLILGFYGKPENIDPSTIFNWVLLLAVFLVGAGYIVILQTLTVWSKQLYPADSRGQFEGIRILFFVLIPMVIAPFISNPIIKQSGKFLDEYGFTEYLPTHTLFLVAAGLVLLTFIPLLFAKKYHDRRIINISHQAVTAHK
jgi:MFS family permease